MNTTSSATVQLAQMCACSGVAMERATQALMQADLSLAEQLMADHDQAMSAPVEEAAFVLL
jgi:phosphate transport system protein